jgi:hypothetical protein
LLFSGLQKNKTVEEDAEKEVQAKKRLYSMTPYPAATNIAVAQAQLAKVKAAVAQSQEWFAPVPFENLTNATFKTHLDTQLARLQQRAAAANTQLHYFFSFQAEKEALSLPAHCFPALPMQLAEVEALVNPLLDARVNALGFIRRPRLAGVDAGQEDCHSQVPTTNDVTHTISTPYEVRFYAFSANLAQVLEAYYRSKHGLVVKAVVVEETGGVETPTSSPAVDVLVPGPGRGRPPPRLRSPDRVDRLEGEGGPPPVPQRVQIQRQAVRPQGGGPATGLTTVLDENLLKISLLIHVIRPLPTTS